MPTEIVNSRFIAEQIFLSGVESVVPDRLIERVMSIEGNSLKIGKRVISLETTGNIYVIGAGKASALMGAAVEKILGNLIRRGHIVVKYGHSCNLNHISLTEAGHPVPDTNGFRATDEILGISRMAGVNDLVICLLSGGGSALLPDLPEGCSPADIAKTFDLLINSGASISEINTVRKHLSSVKGGQLARIVYPATLICLILSDVPGNNPDVIASGPTVPDPTTFSNALAVLSKYALQGTIPRSVLTCLKDGITGKRPETPKPGDQVFENTFNIIVGSNQLALEAAKSKSLEYNINTFIIDDKLQGDTSSVAKYLVEISLKFKNDNYVIKPVCLLFGGETTIRVKGNGKGGRNQHLALQTAFLLQNLPGITILSAGTDGSDGPTDVAGAIVDSDTIQGAIYLGIDPQKYLDSFDSYTFFKENGGHIITGPTFTNVMDIIVVLIS